MGLNAHCPVFTPPAALRGPIGQHPMTLHFLQSPVADERVRLEGRQLHIAADVAVTTEKERSGGSVTSDVILRSQLSVGAETRRRQFTVMSQSLRQ